MSVESVSRAEVVGSLIQSDELLAARQGHQEGTVTAEELEAVEDQAVLDVIGLQESVGLDVITDGEMRRASWADTVRYLNGLEPRHVKRSYPANPFGVAGSTLGGASSPAAFNTVVSRISPKSSATVGSEYPFLAAHAQRRTKYTMAAPSYHRRYWSDEIGHESGYDSCEEFLTDVAAWLHGVGERLVAQGCTYLQLDAPSYGSLCDADNRAWHAEQGHDTEAELAFDAALDSSVFADLPVTRALHICRGNLPGGRFHSNGGYGAIAEAMFPHLDVDVALLEYDSDRAGDFSPITHIPDGTTVVLGLLTTKDHELEEASALTDRIAEATKFRPLDQLAVSTQCGFASASNAPMTVEEQRAKLGLVASVARSVWG
jgi:5-methyltetrahydropteroyltriglutamate--homocysteine methyltransferase